MTRLRAIACWLVSTTALGCGSTDKPPVCADCYQFDASATDGGGIIRPGGFPTSGQGTPGKCDGFGSPMVQVDSPNGSYCIDQYETTVAEYDTFQNAAKNAALPPPCDTNGFQNGPSPAAFDPQLPAWGLSWCDAVGFCKYAGKRLCGSIERNPDAGVFDAGQFDVTTAATGSEWFYACSNGGTTAYPYGDTFNQTTCNAPTINVEPLAEVGAFADCHGLSSPYDQIFDMAGNLEEWEDNCVQEGAEPAPTDKCAMRGGQYLVLVAFDQTTACGFLGDTQPRQSNHDVAGIRCCKDL
jgi:formylglycine-generating enzyme required for sulfatase activity